MEWILEVPRGAVAVAMFGLGACLGSFLNVVIARLPAGESIVWPGSRCPNCKNPIAWYDNIPLLSYWLLRARCRACKTRIAARYFLIELLAAGLVAALWLRFEWSYALALWLPLTLAFLAVAFIDIDHWLVPDVITYPAMLFALAGALLPGGLSFKQALAGVVPALLLWLLAWAFERITGREGMGLGDVKLLAVIGLAVGLVDALSVLLLAALQGTVIGGLTVLTGGHRGSEATPAAEPGAPQPEDDWKPHPRAVPFGPFLVLGTLQVVLLPEWFGNVPARLTDVLMRLLA